MVKRRMVLTIELQEARPNWQKALSSVKFIDFFSEDRIRLRSMDIPRELYSLLSSVKDSAHLNGLEIIIE